ncbi:MAG: sulfur carrier protein ThiS adenylyltransferase ThiF [Candidatus Aminicenantes bacterium]|nr:sulfur carrier protein ThiS adenylyltransferase ThiF [Candidatus Aminicenantes bacterium]
MKTLEKEFFAKHDPDILPILRAGVVGIAGAGGLGSNAALALARAGIGKLIIADSDRIEITNLNRQQYTWSQIGKIKVKALVANLRKVNPFSDYVGIHRRITRTNVAAIFAEADILIEAFDRADQKQMLIETWIARFPDRPIIAASGLSGFGENRKIGQRRIGDLYICGDEASEPRPGISPMAPRVGIVANMQANLAIELLVRRAKK